MIKVYKKENKHDVQLILEGHAGYSSSGNDIVCSAISFLTQTLQESLRLIAHADMEVDSKSGYLDLKVKNCNREQQLLIESCYLGLQMLEQTYPANVEVCKN